jgi:hypothetical protein
MLIHKIFHKQIDNIIIKKHDLLKNDPIIFYYQHGF